MRRLAQEQAEKTKIIEAKKAEKIRRIQANVQAKTERAVLPPVTGNTKTWSVMHVDKGKSEYEEILERSQTAKTNGDKEPLEMVRYLTLINAVQANDRTGRPETLTGICLKDAKTVIRTRRFSQGDRMVYTESLDDRGNPILTIYGLKGHDDTVELMLRRGVAIEKRLK